MVENIPIFRIITRNAEEKKKRVIKRIGMKYLIFRIV